MKGKIQCYQRNLHSHCMFLLFSSSKKLLPTYHAGAFTHFHLSGAHQTSSLQPAGNSLLMRLYFHHDSHLLSSATTSHVYKSVHLPGGCAHLLSLSLFVAVSFHQTILKGREPTEL